MKTLQRVDGCAVTQEERAVATKNVVCSHLTQNTLLSHAYADVQPLPTLSVAPMAESLHQSLSPCSLHISTTSAAECYNKVLHSLTG